MADLILNLISLKSKADAAGVGTTATNSTPSLCPTKSAIPGYVTNGANIVTIYNASSYANNQLVPEANVSVNKTITSTATVYRSVSVGTSSAPDIPASGGSSRASATVTYQQTTRTYYSDGTSTDGTWTNQSATIYGAYVSASSKGTTVSNRTSTGSTSTPSGTVAGATRTGTAVTIYQAANSEVSGYLWFTGGQVSNVSNSGGTSAVPTTSDYRWYATYTSGSEGYTSISASSITWAYGKNTYNSYSGVSFSSSSSNCQYTVSANTGDEKTLGYAVVRGYYNGSYDYIVRQVKQDGGYSSGPTVTGHYLKTYTYSLAHISGSGGTSAVPSFYVHYYTTYSNGTEDYTDVTNSATIKYNKTTTDSEPSSWYTSSSYCQFTCAQNSSSSTTTIGYAWVKAWYNGESKADRSTVKQDGYTAPITNDFIFHWDTFNASGKTTPVLQFYRSGDTTSSGVAYSSGRYGGVGSTSGDVNASWNKTGTISKVYFVENGSSIKKVQINGYNGTTYLTKQSFSTYTMYNLTRSFSTSDYTNGTYRIYAYYYDS